MKSRTEQFPLPFSPLVSETTVSKQSVAHVADNQIHNNQQQLILRQTNCQIDPSLNNTHRTKPTPKFIPLGFVNL